MPKPKYRQPVDQKHKEHLESFNFMNGFTGLARRKSQNSQYSPMGSRLSSRNNSISHPAAMPKMGRGHKYIGKVAENEDDDTDLFNGKLCRKIPEIQKLIHSVGASRRHSLVSGPSRRHSLEAIRPSNLHTFAIVNSDTEIAQSLQPSAQKPSPDPTPHGGYTEAEIAEALKKLALKQQGKGKENAPPR